MKKLCALALMLAVCAQSLAYSANSVIVESKTGANGVRGYSNPVTVGVYIQNSEAIESIALPLEVRSVTAGAFVLTQLNITANPQGRLAGAFSNYVVTSVLPEEDNSKWYKCDGTGFGTRGSADFISPECVFLAAVKGPSESALAANNDGTPGNGTPSVLITFGVNTIRGTFEIDTTCVTPDNHLAFFSIVGSRHEIHPTFTKGIVQINCDCPCHNAWPDPVCDQVISDVLDVVTVTDRAFRAHSPAQDTSCPAQIGYSEERTDMDCNSATDILDVVEVINVAFRGASPGSQYCRDPCSYWGP